MIALLLHNITYNAIHIHIMYKVIITLQHLFVLKCREPIIKSFEGCLRVKIFIYFFQLKLNSLNFNREDNIFNEIKPQEALIL